MNAEMLQVADAVSREKQVEREVVIDAMEQALKTAARRTYPHKHIEVRINRRTGAMEVWHLLQVVEEFSEDNELMENEMLLPQARLENPAAQIGDELRHSLPPIELGRIEAQTAKQVINQKIREAERDRVVREFEHRVGEMITGVVKRTERGVVYVDLGRGEAVMFREDVLPRETFRQADRVRGVLREVRNSPKGAQLFLSRTHPDFVRRLFEQEVPEINEKLITIVSVARDPGSRSKIAVRSNEAGVDPVGACVGMRGSRVQAVVNELHGERIDVIPWNNDLGLLVSSALAPAKTEHVVVYEDTHTIEVAVADDQLALAIGRRGQNVRLASILVGWNIDIMTTGDQRKKREGEVEESSQLFQEWLDVDYPLARLLAEEGFLALEDVAYCDVNELLEIAGLDNDLVHELQKRARDAILEQALTDEQKDEGIIPLEELPGITPELQTELARFEVTSTGELADAALDDFEGIEGVDREQLEALIIAARQACGWFDD